MSGKSFNATLRHAKYDRSYAILMSLRLIAATLILCVQQSGVTANAADRTDNWSSFRNGGNSVVAGQLPLEWSTDKGITWQTETDGYGQSAPIIFSGHVIVASVIGEMKETCALTAYHLHTGEQVWQKTIPATQTGPSNYMNSRAAPTPVADSSGAYAFFETGNLIAVDHGGNELWRRDLAKDFGPFESNHGLGSSLAQTNETLILNLEHKGPSFLLAVNKEDGTTRWKVDRPSGSSWTSPIFDADRKQVIVSSAGSLTAYAIKDGEEIWTHDGLEGHSVPSPCVIDGKLLVGARIPEFGSAKDAAASNLCVSLDGEKSEILWRAESAVCDYASPIVDENQAYFLNKVGVLSCVDIATGKEAYKQRLHAECWATPVVADNGIFFFAKDGTTKVVRRGREFDVIATNELWNKDDPPEPETYREGQGAHGHGAHGGQSGSHGGGRAGGMIAAMMKRDTNKDGVLQADEMSPDFRPMLKRVDTNGDGALDQKELAAMAKSFAERRKNSQASSRDPIVYGVAAIPGTIIIRTGTRLYCVGSSSEVKEDLR